MSDERLTPSDFQDAIHVQSGCNLSGIVHSLSRVMSRIWAEAHATGKGTAWVNRHPIARLYAEQIAYLSGAGGTLDGETYAHAYDVCEKAAKGETIEV